MNSHLDIDDFVYLPDFDEEPDEDADTDDKVGLVIEDVEQHDEGLEDTEEDSAHREALEGLTVTPELDV